MEEANRKGNIVAAIRSGTFSSAGSVKMKRIHKSLMWRQMYLNAPTYCYEFEDLANSTLAICQIENGEISGLGTGAQVWPAAHVLCKYLENKMKKGHFVGKTCADIGSGTGLCGLVAAVLGAEVTLTDQAQLISLLHTNRLETFRKFDIPLEKIAVQVYDWGGEISHLNHPFDVILVSDCVLPKLYPIEPLILATKALMGPLSVAIFSYEHRTYHLFDPREVFFV